MNRKIVSWCRAFLIISALLLSQFSWVVTEKAPAPPVAHAAIQPAPDMVSDQTVTTPPTTGAVALPPPPFPNPDQCELKMNGFALTGNLPGGVPTAPTGPDYYGIPTSIIADSKNATSLTASVGDTIRWMVILSNSSDSECSPARNSTLTNVEAEVIFDNVSVPITSAMLNFQLPSGAPGTSGTLLPGGNGGMAWTIVSWTIPSTVTSSSINIVTRGGAEDADRPITGTPPNDILDSDSDTVSIVGPAVGLTSFTPTPASSSPGQVVSFTLIIQNTRTDTITAIDVTSTNAQFQAACDGIGNWTSAGNPISSLVSGQVAQCVINGVVIPDNPPPDEFLLTGTLTAWAGSLDFTLPVTSGAVHVVLPSVAVEKSIVDIRHNGQVISPPAAPGDTIIYQIVVRNTGDITLDNISIDDSLTGPVIIPATQQITAGASLTYTTNPYTVPQNAEDPLTNNVRVRARGMGTSLTVSAQAVATVDLTDSALEVTLIQTDTNGIPISSALPGTQIIYELTLTNLGLLTLTDVRSLGLNPPLVTVGTPGAIPTSLGPGQTQVITWPYTVTAADMDPLTSTIRIRGTSEQGLLVYGESQTTLNISNPSVDISAAVTQPETGSVLRGNTAVYHLTLTAPSINLCQIRVNMYRRDPDTGQDALIAPNISFPWPGAANELPAGQNVQTDVSYEVTGTDKDPLYMIFEVTSTDCSGTTLTDRSARILDISDAQVNALLDPVLGADNQGTVGETIRFNFYGQNVGPITLTQTRVEYCIFHLPESVEPNCFAPQNEFALVWPDAAFPGRVRPFETATAYFEYTIRPEDLQTSSFAAIATLHAKDNEGKDVVIRTSTVVPIGSNDFTFTLFGPADGDAVIGDEETFTYNLTNKSGGILTDVTVYNWTAPGHPVIGTYPALGIAETVSGTFTYTIAPNADITAEGDVLNLHGRVTGTKAGTSTTSNATLIVGLTPILEVIKTGPSFAIAGTSITYNVQIINHADTQTVDISSYTDNVLTTAGLAAVTDANFSTWAGTPGVLQPEGQTGNSVSGTFTINNVDDDISPLVNEFIVTGNRSYDQGIVMGSDTHEVVISCPLYVTAQITNLDDDPDYVLGEWLHWRITATNISNARIDNITITDTLFYPGVTPSVPFVSWPHTGGNPDGSLNPGETVVIGNPGDVNATGDIRITGEPNPNYIRDTLSVTSLSFCKDAVISVDTYSPIQVTKTANPIIAFTGDPVEYTIQVENVTEMNDSTVGGDYRFYYVTVTDSLLSSPIPFHYNGASNPESVSGQLEPEEEVVTVLTRDVQQNDPAELVNVARATFPDPVRTDQTWFTEDDALVFTGHPLTLIKTPSVTVASAGDTISYDYTIMNVSPYEITNITLVDDKLGDLIPTLTGGRINLHPNESRNLVDVPYVIPLTALDPLTNAAMATGTVHLTDGSTREITNTVVATVDLIDPMLVVTKSAMNSVTGLPLDDLYPTGAPDGTPEANNGSMVDYCFNVANQNQNPAEAFSDIQIEDLMIGPSLQARFEAAVAAIPGLSHPTDTLNGGESVNFCVEDFQVNRNSYGDPVVNTVNITGISTTSAEVHNSDEFTIDLIGTDLMITKTPSSPVAYVGQEIIYTVRIWNRLPGNSIYGITVTDAFLDGPPVQIPLEDFDWTGSNAATPGTLGPGGEAIYTYSYVVQNTDPDPLTNSVMATGTIDSTDPDPDVPVQDGASSSVAVTSSQLLVRKTATPSVVQAGEEVTYNITITNIGTIPVHNLTASDTRYDAEHGVNSLTPLMTSHDLDAYDSAFITYQMTMPTGAQILAAPPTDPLDPYINTVTINGSVTNNQGVTQVVTADATESVDILMPNIRITKSANQQAATQGEAVEYTVTVNNVGDTDLTNLVVTDITANRQLDISSATSTFHYTEEPYIDRNGTPASVEPNPLAGQPYDPAHGLLSHEVLVGTVTVTVPNDFPGSEYTNVVEATAALVAILTPVEDRSSATIDIRDEGIQIEKLASITSGSVGTPVVYTLRITNVGGVPIDRLTISDPAMVTQYPPLGTTTIEGSSNAFDVPNVNDDPTLLEPDEVYTMTYTYTLSAANADPYINSARVTGRTSDTHVNVSDTAQVTVDILAASVMVEKTACVGADTDGLATTINTTCPQYFRLGSGEPITYYLHISNPGTIPVQNVTITDTLVPSSTFSTITWPGAAGELAANDNVAGTGPDEVWFMYPYTVRPTDTDPLSNVVTVSAQTSTTPPVVVTDSVQISLAASELLLTKSVSPAQAQVGDTVTYTFTVQNLSTSTAITNVQIVDPALTGGSSPLPGCTFATLAAGASNTCTATHQVALSDPSPLINTATATGLLGTTQLSDTATATLPIAGASGLLVTKTADRQVAAVGTVITYTYEIRNTGTLPLGQVTVTDSAPNAVFTPAWSSSFAPGQDEVRTITHTVTATDPDPYVNTVNVTANDGTPIPVTAQASARVAISTSALTVTNTPNVTYITPGMPVTFTYTVSNLGSANLTGLTVSDNNLCPTLSTQLASTDLAAGASVTLYCTVPGANVAAPGPIISNFTATALDGTTPLSDSATAQVEVTTGGILVEKTADLTVAVPGNTIHYTVTVTNISAAGVTNITVTDPVVLLSPAPPTTLAAGASFTMTGQYLVPTTTPPNSVSNTVLVTATNMAATTTYSDSDAVAVGILEDPTSTIMLLKEVSQASARPGESVLYTFRVRNLTANQTLTQIDLTDDQLGLATERLPAIAPGNEIVLQRTGTIPLSTIAPVFTNTALAFDVANNVGDEASASITVEVLSLVKTAITNPALRGQPLQFQFEITNNSTAAVAGVALVDAGVTMTDAIATTIPIPSDPGYDAARTGQGNVAIPANYTNPTYSNTAQVTINGTVVDTSTVVVPVTAAGLAIENLQIFETVAGNTLPAVQTGEQGTITFVLHNLGDAAITGLTYSVAVGMPGGSTPLTGCTVFPSGTTSLAIGGTATVTCSFTPPTGQAYTNSNADSYLDVPVTITASGTSNGTVNATLTGTMNLVDLALDVAFTVTPATVDPSAGSTPVTYSITLTNQGLSPLGCDNTVAAAELCHLRLTATPATDTVLQGILTQIMTDNNIANLVINPGASIGPFTYVRNVGSGDSSATHTVVAASGFYLAALGTNNQYYVVQDQAIATLSVGGFVVQNLLVRQIVNGVTLDRVQTGEPATITFTLRNFGSSPITNPNYTIDLGMPAGTTPAPACARTNPVTLPASIPANGSLDITCTYTPPVGMAEYRQPNGLVRTVSVSGSGDPNAVAAAVTAPMTLVDLRLQVNLTLSRNTVNPFDTDTTNDTVIYTVTLTNTGASPIGCSTVIPADPCHIRLSAAPTDTVLASVITAIQSNFSNLVLQPGSTSAPATGTHIFTSAETTVTHVLTATGGFYDQALGANMQYYTTHAEATATVTVSRPAIDILSITPSTSTPPVGSTISYTVTVQNTGSVDLTNLNGSWSIAAATAAVPMRSDGLMLVSAPRRQTASGTLAFGVTTLAAGQTMSVIVQRTETFSTPYNFTVVVNGTGTGSASAVVVTDTTFIRITPTASTTTGTPTATLNPAAVDPIVTKTANVGDAQAGGPVVWTITIRNGGTATMSNVTMRDAMPDTLSIGSATTSRGASVVDGQLLTVTTGALNPGDIVTVTVNTSVITEAVAPAVITNNACAAREGGPTVCAAAVVNVAPGAAVLPTTGIRSSSTPLGTRGEGLFGIALVGALMLLMSTQVSNRRLLIAGVLTLVTMAVITGVVTLVLLPGDDDNDAKPQQVTATPDEMVVAPATTTAPQDGETPIPATTEPVATLEDAIPFELPEQPEPTPYLAPEPTGPRYLMIPKLSGEFQVPIPIVQIPLMQESWDVSGLGSYIGWLEGTTWMDPAWGNTVLAAHVQLGTDHPGPFWGIDTLSPGDEIIVEEGDTQYHFVVSSVAPVDPTDWTVTAPTAGPSLTLITCTNWSESAGVFSQRMVVRAVPAQS